MATSDNFAANIEKLSGPDDWTKWKWHVTFVLRSFGLEDIVTGTRERVWLPPQPTEEQKAAFQQWNQDDAKAASVIAGALTKPVATLVLNCNHAKDIWDTLRAKFERSNVERVDALMESFFRVKRNEKERIVVHVERLKSLYVDVNKELRKLGENPLSERVLKVRIWSTLGGKYDNVRKAWSEISPENQTLSGLIDKLIEFDRKNKSAEEARVVECDYYWRDYDGEIPEDAVVAGHDENGKRVYVGQGYVRNKGMIVVQINSGKKDVYAEMGGVHHLEKNIKILCGCPDNFYWWPTSRAKLLEDLAEKEFVVGGHEDGWGRYFVGRIQCDGGVCVGKVLEKGWAGKTIFIGVDKKNEKVEAETYEVLVNEPCGGCK